MRKVYVALLGLLVVAIAVQFYLAAVGGFDTPHDDDSFAAHRVNGMMVIPIITLLATVAAALARVGGKLIGLTILPVGLVILQSIIRAIAEAFNTSSGDTSTASVIIFGLHAINGLAIFFLVGHLLRRARALMASPSPSSPAKTTQSTPV